KKSLLLLEANPFHPSLRLHKLKGNLVEYHSVSIDLKYRILIDFIIQDDKIILIDIGDHGLYE
ncbi:MAG: plasmid stabilization protein, partial [Saprospiraceae bacterium]